jgi:hypothetical protein
MIQLMESFFCVLTQSFKLSIVAFIFHDITILITIIKGGQQHRHNCGKNYHQKPLSTEKNLQIIQGVNIYRHPKVIQDYPKTI